MESINSEHKQVISKDTALTLRGIAAVMVILSHYAEWYSWFVPTEGRAEIFRVSLSKLGVYGVDIFFLLSGYAMVKSLGDKKINHDFIFKRIRNVYLPYIVVTGVIELISGGFTSLYDFWQFASGYDYWYMNILFIFYIAFIFIYAIIKNKPIRVGIFCVFTYIYSYMMYAQGRYYFWYVSNFTFALGIVIAECESLAIYKKISKKLTIKWQIKKKIFALLGRNSLYLYLTHTYIFMRCVNSQSLTNIAVNEKTALMFKFAISAVVTVVVSILCRLIITKLTTTLSYLKNKSGHKG